MDMSANEALNHIWTNYPVDLELQSPIYPWRSRFSLIVDTESFLEVSIDNHYIKSVQEDHLTRVCSYLRLKFHDFGYPRNVERCRFADSLYAVEDWTDTCNKEWVTEIISKWAHFPEITTLEGKPFYGLGGDVEHTQQMEYLSQQMGALRFVQEAAISYRMEFDQFTLSFRTDCYPSVRRVASHLVTDLDYRREGRLHLAIAEKLELYNRLTS